MLKDLKKSGVGYVDENDVYWESKLEYMCCEVLISCGCGNPGSIGLYVLQMLKKHVSDGTPSGHDAWDNNKYENLPLMFFLSWAEKEEYTEHGTTIRCSWLTDKGKELVKDLESIKKEMEDYGKAYQKRKQLSV